jgi:hypothetical protein
MAPSAVVASRRKKVCPLIWPIRKPSSLSMPLTRDD